MTVAHLLPSDGRSVPVVATSPFPARVLTSEALVGPRATGGGNQADRPPPVTFTIPAPPSTNALFKNIPGKGRAKSKDYTDWLMQAHVAIRRQRVHSVPGRVIVLVGFERHSNQADVDNRLKATLDLLVKAGLIEDDRFISFAPAFWMPAANHLAHVAIYPCQRMTLTFHPSHDGASGALVVDAPQPIEDFNDETL